MTDEGRRLGMPLEIAKQNLRDDPHTRQIAEALGVELEDYIEKVLDYALHPDKQPQLELLDDDSVAELGPEAPSVDDVTKWFEAVARGDVQLDERVKIAESDGYAAGAEPAEVLRARAGGEGAPRRAPGVEEIARGRAKPGAGSVLEDQLRARQRDFQLGMDARRAGQAKKIPPKRP